MPSFDQIVSASAARKVAALPSIAISKQDAVAAKSSPIDPYVMAAASPQERQDIGSQQQRDYYAMPIGEYALKYGKDGMGTLVQAVQAGDKYRADSTAYSSMGEDIANTGMGVLSGVVGGAADLTNIPMAFTPWAGEYAQGTSALKQSLSRARVGGANARADAYQARQAASEGASAVQQERDTARYGDLIAGAMRVGRDALNTLGNMDGQNIADVAAQGLGSLIISGGMAGKIGGLAAVGLQEGASAYTDTTAGIMNMSHEDLMANSPEYAALIKENYSPNVARDIVAKRAGVSAGVAQGTMGALISKVTGAAKIEESLGKMTHGGLMKTLADTGKEVLEESAQGYTGTTIQNAATQFFGNRNQDLNAGVGASMAEGAIGALGSTGVIHTPGLVGHYGAKAVKGIQAKVSSVTSKELDSQYAELAPVVEEQAKATNDAVSSMQEIAATDPNKVATVQDLYAKMVPDISNHAGVPEDIQKNVADSSSPVEALLKMQRVIQDPTVDSKVRDAVAVAATDYYINIQDALEANKLADPELENSEPAAKFDAAIAVIMDGMSTISLDSVRKHVQEQADTRLDMLENMPGIEQYSPDQIREYAKYLTYSNPNRKIKLAPEQAANLLFQSEKEGIPLTNKQKASLLSIGSEAAIVTELTNKGITLGDQSNAVTRNIVDARTGDRMTGKKTVLEHVKSVVQAYKAGNDELAATNADQMGQFVKHMQGKYKALSEAIEKTKKTGNTTVVNYPVWNGRAWAGKGAMTAYAGDKLQSSERLLSKMSAELAALESGYDMVANIFPEAIQERVETSKVIAPEEINKALRAWEKPSEVKETSKGEETKKSEATETKPVEVTEEVAPKVVEEEEDASFEQEDGESGDLSTLAFAKVKNKAGHIVNQMARAFKPRATGFNKVISDPDLIKNLYLALANGSEEDIANLFGKYADDVLALISDDSEYSNNLPAAFNELFTELGKVKERMNSKLNARLKSMTDSQLAAFLDSPQGAAASLAFPTRHKNYTRWEYSPEYLHAGLLAAAQWYITRSTPQSISGRPVPVSVEDAEGVSHAGFMTSNIVVDLANSIEQFWGLTRDKNAPSDMAQRVLNGFAAEMLDALSYKEEGLIFKGKSYNERYGTTSDLYYRNPAFSRTYLDVLTGSKLIPLLLEMPKESGIFFDEPLGEVDTRVRNTDINITPLQEKALAKMQSIPSRINLHTANLTFHLGVDFWVNLMGGDTKATKKNTNVMHLPSVTGKNASIAGSYHAVQDLLNNVYAQATKRGVSMDKVDVYRKYYVASNNRFMIDAPYNEQSNKMMRSVLLPTWSTVDLTSKESEDYKYFMVGIAQANGTKVSNIPMEDSIRAAEGYYTSEAGSAALELAQEVVANNSYKANAKKLRKALVALRDEKGSLSHDGIHALMEYARFKNAEKAGNLKGFETSLFIEADGITNGTIHSIMNLSGNFFDADSLAALERGGVTFRPYEGGSTNAELRDASVKGPYYKAASDNYAGAAKLLVEKVIAASEANPALKNITDILSILGSVNQDVTDEYGDTLLLSIARDFLKNPMTILQYGSGEKGVAGNIVSDIINEYAQNLSAFSRGTSTINEEDAILFGEALNTILADNPVDFSRNPLDIEITAKQAAQLTSYINSNFMPYLTEAVQEVIGKDVSADQTLLKDVSVYSTLYGSWMYHKAYEKLRAQRVAEGAIKHYEMLSAKDEAAIYKETSKYQLNFSNYNQAFSIGPESKAIGSSKNFSDKNPVLRASNLDGKMLTPIFKTAPTSGVGLLALMNISLGDAQAIQNLFLNSKLSSRELEKVLQIFDGVHVPIKGASKYGVEVNAAAAKTWHQAHLNELSKKVSESFNDFNPSDLDELFEFYKSQMIEAGWSPRAFEGEPGAVLRMELSQAMALLPYRLEDLARNQKIAADIRSDVSYSSDQMSGLSSPFVTNKTISFDSDASIAEVSEGLKAEFVKRLADSSKPPVDTSKIVATLNEQADKATLINRINNTRMFAGEDLQYLALRFSLEGERKALFDALSKSPSFKDLTVFVGTHAEMVEAALENNIAIDPNKPFNGFYDPITHRMFISRQTPEILMHELIHATTARAVNQYFYSPNSVAPTTRRAIQELYKAMETVVKYDNKTNSYSLNPSFGSVKDLKTLQSFHHMIASMNAAGNNAAQLQEFMAWVVTNKNIKAETSLRDKVVKIWRHVKSLVKSILGESFTAPENLWDEISFNTLAVSAEVKGRSASDTLFNGLFHNESSELLSRYMNTAPEAFNNRLVGKSAQSVDDFLNSLKANSLISSSEEFESIKIIAGSIINEVVGNSSHYRELDVLYNKIISSLSAKDFETVGDDQDKAQATQLYNLLGGKRTDLHDSNSRNVAMPVTIGLAVMNDAFRAKLSAVGMDKVKIGNYSGIDEILEGFGHAMMDSLNRFVSGRTMKDSTLTKAIDQVIGSAYAKDGNFKATISKYLAAGKDYVDLANDWLVSRINDLSSYSAGLSDKARNKGANKGVQAAADFTAVITASISDDKAKFIAEDMISLTNRKMMEQSPTASFEVMRDVIGRLESFAEVFDLIKLAKKTSSQVRQQFREVFPKTMRAQFKKELTVQEMAEFKKAVIDTDLSAILRGKTPPQFIKIIKDDFFRTNRIDRSKRAIMNEAPRYGKAMLASASDLAQYLAGENVPTSNLKLNSFAISQKDSAFRQEATESLLWNLDEYVSLNAYEALPEATKTFLKDLLDREEEGVMFTMATLLNIRMEEDRKAEQSYVARMNGRKGYLPSLRKSDAKVLLVPTKDVVGMKQKGYSVIGTSNEHHDVVYMVSTVPTETMFQQGIVQSVRPTVNGVTTTDGMPADYTGPVSFAKATKELVTKNKKAQYTHLPYYDENGSIAAYERVIDKGLLAKYETREEDIFNLIGLWKGRQEEEKASYEINTLAENAVVSMYDRYKNNPTAVKEEFVNLDDLKDPLFKKAFANMPMYVRKELRTAFKEAYGVDGIFIRKDVVEDIIGVHRASVGDLWTGSSRWSEDTQTKAKAFLKYLIGPEAFVKLIKYEKMLQTVVQDSKETIIVRSIVVPAYNIMSNFYQLIANGVSPVSIVTRTPHILAEIDSYTKMTSDLMNVKAKLLATRNKEARSVLEARISSIEDAISRMSIKPLLDAGEFTAISDAGLRDNSLLTNNKLYENAKAIYDKMPKSAQTFARYGLMTRDTPLYRAMQKAVDYGDFVAKAILYEHLTKNKKMSSKEALGYISEEFVNYDRSAGRNRDYLESVGLLWFWNFKLRSIKVALRMVRRNPLYALIGMAMPSMNGIGTPIDDNAFSLLVDGKIGNSIGPSSIFTGPLMLPVIEAL